MGDAMGTPGFTTDKGRYQTGKLPARCERFMTDTEQHFETQFASAGQHRVAYRISGAGSCDVLINPGLQSRINLIRSEPGHVNFRHGLESFSRCISFDGLGTGISDRPSMNNRSAVEDWVDSCGAVLDAVGSTAPVIIGVFGSVHLVLQFVRRYPQRFSGLVLINTYTYACWVSRSDYPEGTPPEEIANSREFINKAWGRTGLPAPAAPSQAGNEAFLQWNATLQHVIATPNAVVAGLSVLAELDSRDVLPDIRVPTLVMARTGLTPGAFARTQYMATRVSHARFIELPGPDIAPCYETPEVVLRQIALHWKQACNFDLICAIRTCRAAKTRSISTFHDGFRPERGSSSPCESRSTKVMLS